MFVGRRESNPDNGCGKPLAPSAAAEALPIHR